MKRGVAALPTLLIIGAVIVEIAVAGAFLAFAFVSSGLSARLETEARTVARAGIQDALLRLVRDKGFASTGYSLTVGSYSTTVTVTQNDDCAGSTPPEKACITSHATALTRQKKLQAATTVNATTGEVRIITLFEVAI